MVLKFCCNVTLPTSNYLKLLPGVDATLDHIVSGDSPGGWIPQLPENRAATRRTKLNDPGRKSSPNAGGLVVRDFFFEKIPRKSRLVKYYSIWPITLFVDVDLE